MNPAPNLIFIGPMGAGKTTVGRHVAELLGLPFHDLDHEIEAHTRRRDQPHFRSGRRSRLPQARKRPCSPSSRPAAASCSSTGGGAVLAEENRRVLRARGFVIWLDATIEAQLATARARSPAAAAERAGSSRAARATRQRSAIRSIAEIADLRIASAGTGNSVPRRAQIVGDCSTRTLAARRATGLAA